MYDRPYTPRLEDHISQYKFSSPSIYHSASQAAAYQNSSLEYLAKGESYVINLDRKPVETISEKKTYEKKEYHLQPIIKEEFTADTFLKPSKVFVPFVGSAGEIREFIRDAFLQTTNLTLPEDIIFHVLPLEEFKEAHGKFGSAWDDGILGFSINRNHINLPSLVFARKERLDKILLTIGHEIGHVMSLTLSDKHNEEAKAFAFSMAWMRVIKEKDIANIGENIELDIPARNGLHNVACDFVLGKLKSGVEPLKLFHSLVKGEEKVKLESFIE